MSDVTGKIKDFGYSLLGLGFMVGLILLAILVLTGGVWLSAVIYPIIVIVSRFTFIVSIFILLPLSIFRKTRFFSGQSLLVASYVIGFSTWMWSFLLVYSAWGFWGLIVGLFLLGVGVVPVAMLAALVNGQWSILIELVLCILVIYGGRVLAIKLMESRNESVRNVEVI